MRGMTHGLRGITCSPFSVRIGTFWYLDHDISLLVKIEISTSSRGTSANANMARTIMQGGLAVICMQRRYLGYILKKARSNIIRDRNGTDDGVSHGCSSSRRRRWHYLIKLTRGKLRLGLEGEGLLEVFALLIGLPFDVTAHRVRHDRACVSRNEGCNERCASPLKVRVREETDLSMAW